MCKIGCIECKHIRFNYVEFCKANPPIKFGPLHGEAPDYEYCKDKNKDGNCKEFSQLSPFGHIIRKIFPPII